MNQQRNKIQIKRNRKGNYKGQTKTKLQKIFGEKKNQPESNY